MGQPSALDGLPFNPFSHVQYVLPPPEVDIGGRDVAKALMIPGVIVMLDEAKHGLLEIAGQVVVFQQDAVLQGLVPALDLALGLGMVGRTAHVIHAVVAEPFGEFG